MRSVQVFVCLTAVFLVGCASGPPTPPGDLAVEILVDLDAGQPASADQRFEKSARDEASRDTIYPILFEGARASYEEADARRAIVILRFLTAHYPTAAAAREALLYASFLDRASRPSADPAQVAEIERLVQEVRSISVNPPVWVDLIAAQNDIDLGRLAEGKAALDRFKARWDGDPEELLEYVEELERFFRSHAAAEKSRNAEHARR